MALTFFVLFQLALEGRLVDDDVGGRFGPGPQALGGRSGDVVRHGAITVPVAGEHRRRGTGLVGAFHPAIEGVQPVVASFMSGRLRRPLSAFEVFGGRSRGSLGMLGRRRVGRSPSQSPAATQRRRIKSKIPVSLDEVIE